MGRFWKVLLSGVTAAALLTGCAGTAGDTRSREVRVVNEGIYKFEQLENGKLEIKTTVTAEGGLLKQVEEETMETLTFVKTKKGHDVLYHSETKKDGKTGISEMKIIGGKVSVRKEEGEWVKQDGQQKGSFTPFGKQLKDGAATARELPGENGSDYEFTMLEPTLSQITKEMSSNNVMLESVGTYSVDSSGMLYRLHAVTKSRLTLGGENGGESVTDIVIIDSDTRLVEQNIAGLTAIE